LTVVEPTMASVCIVLPARIENLPRFIKPVMEVARNLSIGEDRCHDLELAVEESLANICSYAYPEASGQVQVTCAEQKDRLVVSIEDQGIAFDMDSADPADLSADISTRRVGGLGIHLVRSLMDDVCYQRVNGWNRLELALRFKPGEGKR
jgi:serine/threonine-protein kinase RsbW